MILNKYILDFCTYTEKIEFSQIKRVGLGSGAHEIANCNPAAHQK